MKELKAYEKKQVSVRWQQILNEYIPEFDDGKDMLEISEEEDVAEVRGLSTSLGKRKSPCNKYN